MSEEATADDFDTSEVRVRTMEQRHEGDNDDMRDRKRPDQARFAGDRIGTLFLSRRWQRQKKNSDT